MSTKLGVTGNFVSSLYLLRKILANFLEIRNLYQHDNGQDLILFNNKDILIDGNSFFLQKWTEKGVILIQDILDNDGNIYIISGKI